MMAELSDFIDQDEIDAELAHGEDVHREKVNLANRAARYARSIAPADSGEYKNQIVVEEDGDDVYVAFNDPKSNLIEYGTIDTPEFAVRARTEAYFNQSQS